MARSPIVVRINLADMPPEAQHDFDHWGDWLGTKLREAGIPANRGGDIEEGTLRRFDDPESWSVTIYEWWPDGWPPSEH